MKNNSIFSTIIAGTMTWGSWGKQLSKKEMTNLIAHCVAHHITTFDHADIYGSYTTETEFGDAFAESGIQRSVVQFISKCGIQYVCENRNTRVKHYNYSKNYLIESVEASLKRLKTDYLDLLLLHRPSPLMDFEEVAETIALLKQQGKIKDFGLSNFTPLQTDLVLSKIHVSVNQIQFSLTHFEAMLNGSLDHIQLRGILPMAWSPLGNIFKEENAQTKRIKALLFELMEKYQITADQLLLAWVLKHPARIHPVIGTTDKSRIIHAIKALEITLELEDWFNMWVTSQGHKVP